MKYIISLFLILFFTVPFSGCGKKQAPVKKPVAAKVTSAAEEMKEEKKESQQASLTGQQEYTYDAKGRRDPFLSLVTITKQKPAKKRGASPFESYDIDELRLLAIAWDKTKHYALIMLPDRKSYTITEGMILGLQGGKVVKITKDAVFIREYVKDYKGDIKPRDAILKLHKGEE